MDVGRDPCPFRIVDDVGNGFMLGCIGGGLVHAYKGMRAHPKGEKLGGALSFVRQRAPRTGGAFASWMGLFSAFECGLIAIRGVEDPWNPIIGGAATSAALTVRKGPKVMASAFVYGGVALAIMEGAIMLISRQFNDMVAPKAPTVPLPPKEKPTQQPARLNEWATDETQAPGLKGLFPEMYASEGTTGEQAGY